jgi:hypothetical protein
MCLYHRNVLFFGVGGKAATLRVCCVCAVYYFCCTVPGAGHCVLLLLGCLVGAQVVLVALAFGLTDLMCLMLTSIDCHVGARLMFHR